mmetsp:Transcript_30438/g.76247  ORF Transcript_30438/g.76247 Transcript_30438/m.76247 type:complete len:141 (+) Transcript_30438:161-583(+)
MRLTLETPNASHRCSPFFAPTPTAALSSCFNTTFAGELSPAQLTNDGHHPLQGKFKDKTGTRTSDRKATEVPLLVEAWTKLLARWISIAIPPEGEREVMEEGEQRLMQSAAQRATLDARLSKCKPRAPLRLEPRCLLKPI